MVQNILQTLCEVDPDNADYYTENANDYLSQLDQLDQEIRTVVANGNRKEIVFGSRFALFYFTHEYGLEYKDVYKRQLCSRPRLCILAFYKTARPTV